MEKQVHFNWKGNRIAATVHYPKRVIVKEVPLVIICHGFVGSRVGVHRLFVKAARHFTEQGYAVLRFDYAGCGESDGDYGKTRFEDFISQTEHAITFGRQLVGIDSKQIILLGHSLGGAVALLTAIKHPDIQRLIMWSAVGNPKQDLFDIIGRKSNHDLRKFGAVDYLGYTLQESFFDSMNKFHPLKEAARFTGDVLLAHGTDDDEIPAAYCCDYADAFHSRVRGECDQIFINDANHTFTCDEHQTQLFTVTKQWLKKIQCSSAYAG
ncbi:alpha/beta hydrolase family protein [Heyndrickxia ginsengihumi]|uniref:alpha/beta hydrolase family protein n=1 Tax=Heyndrickxia ginsengihumi TaxID=363870 RepID=UPI00046ED35E|nr:alpha/beta fold hydrolase [Heyndrickxia ginsengihumi]